MRAQRIIFIIVLITATASCSAKHPQINGVPESAELSQFSLPHDPSQPTYVLVVEPVTLPRIEIPIHDGLMTCEAYGGPRDVIQSSLISALLSVENFSLLDYQHTSSRFLKSGAYLRKDEKGPYLVRVAVTEFSSKADEKRKGMGNVNFDEDESLAESVAKTAAWIPLFWFGTLTSLPTSWSVELQKGMVGLDVSVLNPNTKEILLSFPVHGTFSSKSRTIGHRYGFGFYLEEHAESALEG